MAVSFPVASQGARVALLLFSFVFAAVPLPAAATGATSAARGIPLEQILEADGSLDLSQGQSGAIDLSGYEVTVADHGPRFAKVSRTARLAGSPDTQWAPGFHISGATGHVNAVAVSGGNLYIGGFFTRVGDVLANSVAKWDGTTWSALGSGVSGNRFVYSLAVFGGDLYVGGNFSVSGVPGTSGIARWNGTSWSALGTGTNCCVSAMVESGGYLWIGGSFTTVNGSTALRLARWDGSSWSTTGGTGMSATVWALATDGTNLWAGGDFTTADGVAANRVAKWDGSSWSALGSGTDSSVRALLYSGGTLYAGGTFATAGGSAAIRVASWNGATWSAMGSGSAATVNSLAMYGGQVHAAAGGASTSLRRWDGISWTTVGGNFTLVGGTSPEALALATDGTTLYVSGSFLEVAGVPAANIVRWDGTSYSAAMVPVGKGTPGSYETYNYGTQNAYALYALAVSGGGGVYAGGDFTHIGDAAASRIARWNGSGWQKMGSGIGSSSTVRAVAVKGGDVFVGGDFTTAGGVTVNRIAKWNGSTWSALAGGMDGIVHALASDGTNVYAGGTFVTAGGVSATRIAKWNGTTWSPLGSGVNSDLYAIALSGSDLYAGGSFTTAGGSPANYVARWNGGAWSVLGTGANNYVRALAVSGSDLYVGGDFTTAGGVTVNRVAKWNGTSWSAMGSGAGDKVRALVVAGSDVYAAGDFTTMNGAAANRVARWNGSTWQPLGSGVVGTAVFALAAQDSNIWAGGRFSKAGSRFSDDVALFVNCGDGVVDGGEQCDDGNAFAADGCSGACTIEPGWNCSGSPSVCTPACGDGISAAGEGCDDGNTAGGDCCSSTCQYEPDLTACGSPDATGCNAADSCDATGTCVDRKKAAATVCLAGTGPCDPDDTCDGTTNACAAVYAAELTTCGDADATACNEADSCNATGMCVDRKKAAMTVCLTGTGPCDPNDTCDGTTNACVAVYAAELTTCGDADATACNAADSCNATGTCVDRKKAAATVCLTGTGPCDPNDTCDGTTNACAAVYEPDLTACGSPDATACNAADSCDATGTCVDRKKAAATVCLAGTGTCDPNDTCDGTSNACAAVYAAELTTCGDADATACNAADSCNATGACVDRKKAAATVCLAGTGTCDPDDTCDGTTNACTAVYTAAATACGSGSTTECDDPDACNGTGFCQANNKANTVSCGADGNVCTNDLCDGSGTCGHPNNSASCDDGQYCTDGDICSGGSCTSGQPRSCSDGNECTADSCNESTDACVSVNNNLPCSGDGVECTENDVCVDGSCRVGPPNDALCGVEEFCSPSGCKSFAQEIAECPDAPSPDCLASTVDGQSSFDLKDADPSSTLKWKWIKGEQTDYADLGDPATSTLYHLCLYEDVDGTPLLSEYPIPTMDWTAAGSTGFRYKSTDGAGAGITTVKLKSGDSPRPLVRVRGKGANLTVPSVPLALGVVVELRNSVGTCWSNSFSSASQNADGKFQATAD